MWAPRAPRRRAGHPSEHAPHHPVRPDARDVEYIGRDHPSLVLPEVERGRARVAPQESRAILFTERSDGERQQGVTDAAPHEVAARRHAAHLPGVRALARDAHARDAADVLAAGRKKRAVVARRRLVVAVEAGAFDRQAGAELGVAKRQDLFERCASQLQGGCHATIASASISMSAPSTSLDTSTMLVAGRMSRNTSPCARPTSSNAAMSVTKMRVRTTSSIPPPSASMAARMIARARRACSPMVAG